MAVSDITKAVENMAKIISVPAKELSWALLDSSIDNDATQPGVSSDI